MKRLVFESVLLLLYFEWIMRRRDFKEHHRIVREESVRSIPAVRRPSYLDLCRAMDYACVLYFRRVLCLQRSSATTILLRRHGWQAEMLIGVQVVPLKSHAWCEVSGVVVNDKPYLHNMYQVLERC
jgi:Transglutaminase-like superfamily